MDAIRNFWAVVKTFRSDHWREISQYFVTISAASMGFFFGDSSGTENWVAVIASGLGTIYASWHMQALKITASPPPGTPVISDRAKAFIIWGSALCFLVAAVSKGIANQRQQSKLEAAVIEDLNNIPNRIFGGDSIEKIYNDDVQAVATKRNITEEKVLSIIKERDFKRRASTHQLLKFEIEKRLTEKDRTGAEAIALTQAQALQKARALPTRTEVVGWVEASKIRIQFRDVETAWTHVLNANVPELKECDPDTWAIGNAQYITVLKYHQEQTKDFRAAIRECEELVSVLSTQKGKKRGPEAKETVRARRLLADIYAADEQFRKAEGLYEEVLRVQEKAFEVQKDEKKAFKEKTEILKTSSAIAKVIADQGMKRMKEAELKERALLPLKEKHFGVDHLETLRTCFHLAWDLEKQGNTIEALQHAQRTLDGRRKNLGIDGAATVEAQAMVDRLSEVLKKESANLTL